MLTNLTCMHTLKKKQRLVFLIHAHVAVTTVRNLFKHFTVHIEHGRKTAIANECELIAVRDAYFYFIPYQITFAYTAPPTGLLTNGESMTHLNARLLASVMNNINHQNTILR